LVAVLGTGSVVYGEGPQRTIKIGGYGGKIGDAASGLHLGWRTIQAALADLEGYGAKTDMTAKVCDWAQTTTAAGLLEAIYQPGFDERRVSDLAVPCLELAARDAVCCQIVEHEGRILIAQLRTAWLALGASPTLPVGLAGGLSRWWLPFLAPMAAELGISIPLTTVTAVPSEGAAYLARRWSRDVSDATEDTQEH
jgi:N-acetylglucosamine kinase-like BadF-type ATPase